MKNSERLTKIIACILYAEYDLIQANTPDIDDAKILENAAAIIKDPETADYAQKFWGYQAATMVNESGQYDKKARR